MPKPWQNSELDVGTVLVMRYILFVSAKTKAMTQFSFLWTSPVSLFFSQSILYG